MFLVLPPPTLKSKATATTASGNHYTVMLSAGKVGTDLGAVDAVALCS